jgi:hypothetical protein
VFWVDVAGKPRASMTVGKVGPGLRITDMAGKPRGVVKDEPVLGTLDAKGQPTWEAP